MPASDIPVFAENPYRDVVDLARYPIHALHSTAGQALVADCRRTLRDEGACALNGFIKPDAGGVFEYVPWLRDDDNPHYADVQNVLHGDRSRIKTLRSDPGTLAFFRGEHAMHQVTPVTGSKPRINSVLTYGVRPDMRLNALTSELFYGRVSPQP